MKSIVAATTCVLLVLSLATLRAADEKPAATPFDAVKSLAGTWVGDKPMAEGMPASTHEFKVIANGSAVAETMMPGTAHEMINLYHMDGDKLMMTHYCAQGIQPRMKLASSDKGVLKFEFLDCTNLKSRDDPHMDSVELNIGEDKLVENWSFFQDGKVTEHAVFELHRKKA